MKKRLVALFLSAITAVTLGTVFGACGGKDDGKIHITIDGGGANASFISTPSMNKSESNPYPYNTLEVLCNKYMETHENVVIEINRTSLGSVRSTIKPLLEGKNAPHLLYQITPDLLSDALNGYYVDLTDALEGPNEYCKPGTPGAERWADIYNEKELLATRCSNGHYYNVCLEKMPIGILYNKTFFEKNGIKVPETFGEFMQAQQQIKALGMNPYYPIYNWYDIYLEVSVFAEMVPTFDVVEKDGFVSTEEILRAYYSGEWGINPTPTTEAERRYLEYVNLIEKRMQYYPDGYMGLDAEREFLNGKVAMIEATGGYMVRINDDTTKDFEVGVIGFPTLAEGDSRYGGYGAFRGSAGLCTGYYITNRAIKDGDETVAACIDLLKYLTAPEQNDKLINDRGFAIPISQEAEVNDIFKPLVEIYNNDLNDPKRLDWNAFNSWNSFDNTYYEGWLDDIDAFKAGSLDKQGLLKRLQSETAQAAARLSEKTGWTRDNMGTTWGKVNG